MQKLTKLSAALILAATVAAPALAAPETFNVEPNHTFPRFSYNHLGYSVQLSRFDKTSGKVVLDKAAKTGSVDIVINTKSVSTGSDVFNEHIQGEDFLDTAKYPTATFKSTKVVFEGDKPAKDRRQPNPQGCHQAGHPDRHLLPDHAAPDGQEGCARRQCLYYRQAYRLQHGQERALRW
jgi:hypothetical protein